MHLLFKTRHRDKTTTAYDVTEAMRINGSGNVGIGITDPVSKLDVNGNIRMYGKDAARYLDFYWHDDNGFIGTGTFLIGIRFYNNEDDDQATVSNLNSYGLAGEILHYHGSGGDYSDGFDFKTYNAGSGTSWGSTTSKMRILGNGNVGIGTFNPTRTLDVNGTSNFNGTIYASGTDTYSGYHFQAAYGWETYRWDIGQANQPTWSRIALKAPNNSTILCGNIVTFCHNTSSDSRIKTDISLVVDDIALNRVNALESKEYHYIDPERRRAMKTIGFIAQEVNEVLPNAVSLQKDWIPDEMRIITDPQWTEDARKYYLNIPDLDMSGAFTGKAKFYVSNDPSGNDEVCKEVEIKEVPDNSQPLLFPSATKFVAEFDKNWNNVFFYGKEVTDFHTIDKNQIFALHHSAIQELSRRNDKLQQDNDTKTSKIASLESRVEALEEAILAMQSLIQGLQ